LAVSLSTFIILITLNFQNRDKYIYFVLFLFAALLLMALVNFIKQNTRTLPHDQNSFRRGWIYWISISVAIMVVAVFFSWHSPQVKIHQVQAFAREKNPWRETIDLYWRNFFAPVPGNSVGLAHGGQYNLAFGGSLVLSDQVVFVIKTDQSNYWKTQIYDYYDTTGWKVSPTKEISLNKGEIATPIASWPEYTSLSYTLLPQVNTNVVPVPGELVSGDFPITEKDLTPLQFTLNLVDSSQDALLPADLASLAFSLRAARITTRNDRTITSRLPADIKLVAVNRSGSRSITVVRSATEDEDAISISSFSPMSNQKPYQLNARVPASFTPDQLMKAGEDYPEDITDRNLQLPSDFPSSVKDLTSSLTADIDNAYAKALLIKSYLSKIPYSLTIKAPPQGADGVDYFLFTQKSGYCTYFASAMAVMLRSAGIPARMAVGLRPANTMLQSSGS
jgi:transglutaminase-like putative cysteine protease